MRSNTRLALVVIASALLGLLLGTVKGDSAGLRGAIGNLSAPWLLIPMFGGFFAPRRWRGAAAGVAATGAALVGFYAALTMTLAGHLAGGGALNEFATEVHANRLYFLFGACSAPLAGVTGAWLRGRPEWTPIFTGATVAGELVVVAAVHGHELLPRPFYFAWAVADWWPYVIECAVGLGLLVFGLWRRQAPRSDDL